MSGAISNHSVGRGLLNVISGGSFKEGGDYLKNNDIQSFFLSVLSFITLGAYGTGNANQEIRQKMNTLGTESNNFSKKFIEAPNDGNGNYQCKILVNEDIDGVQSNTTFTIDCANNKFTTSNDRVTTSNQEVDEDDVQDNISPQDMKRALLKHYLEEQRDKNLDSTITLDKTTLDLSHIDDLSDIDFTGFELDRHNLDCLIKKNGSLRGAILMQGIDLQGLKLSGIKIDRAILDRLMRENHLTPGMVNLQGVDLSGQQDLQNLCALKQDFSGANFNGSNCREAKFNHSIFTGASFIDANCSYANFNGANLTGIQTSPVILDERNQITSGTNFQQSILIETTGASQNFDKQSLPIGAIWNSKLVKEMYQNGRRDFNGLVLHPLKGGLIVGNFENQDLNGSTFKNSQLAKTDFRGTDLTDVNFNGAVLKYIKVNSETKLRGTDLTNAKITGVDLSSVDIDSTTIIKGADLNGSKLNISWVLQAIAQEVSLKGADLSGIDLSGLNLSKLNLTDVNFTEATIQGTTLNKSGLIAAIKSRSVMAPQQEGNLSNAQERVSADLKGIILRGTKDQPLVLSTDDENSKIDLKHVDFTGATFEHCDLSGAQLAYANFTGVDLSTTFLANANGALKVTVSDDDHKQYEDIYSRRLNFLVNGTKLNQDPVYEISDRTYNELSQGIFFTPSEIGLEMGDHFTYDVGPQNIYNTTYGVVDERGFVNTADSKEQKNHDAVNNRLLQQEFTKEQKILFQQARAGMWTALNAFSLMHGSKTQETFKSIEALRQNQRITQAEYNRRMTEMDGPDGNLGAVKVGEQTITIYDLKSERVKDEMYLSRHVEGSAPKLNQRMMGVTFDIVAAGFSKREKPETKLTEAEIASVREFFTDTKYAW